MVIRYRTSRGTDVFGLAVRNERNSSLWDLGPTWCYLISGRKNTLIDTGRFGNLPFLESLLKSIGKEITDIDIVIPTHSHEDHDGNVVEILNASGAELWAHEIYGRLIRYYPHIKEGAIHPHLPGSCRLCIMPEKFIEHCLNYHQKRSLLNIDFQIGDEQSSPEDSLSFVFTPGHTSDSVCVLLEDEVLFTGDTLLPDITPHPSRAHAFIVNRSILPERYRAENTVYGLMNYIRSLNKIATIPSQPLQATFTAHRMFFKGEFRLVDSSADRSREIIRFHIERCREILRLTEGKPTGIKDIAMKHFTPNLMANEGEAAACNEVTAHVELMKECGDIRWIDLDKDIVQPTGSNNYIDVIKAYL